MANSELYSITVDVTEEIQHQDSYKKRYFHLFKTIRASPWDSNNKVFGCLQHSLSCFWQLVESCKDDQARLVRLFDYKKQEVLEVSRSRLVMECEQDCTIGWS